MALTITQVVAQFGAYYLNQGQNLSRLYSLLRSTTNTESMFTPINTDDTIWRAAKTMFSRVVQPFQKAFTPLAGVEFTPVEIKQFKMKVDAQEYPDELEATWLGFLDGLDADIDRKTWPFVRWYCEVYLIPQIKQDIEHHEIYGGVYVAPVAGTPGAAGTSMDGLRKTINGHVTAGRITPIITGALDVTNPEALVEQFEKFADGIHQDYWDIPMILGTSPAVARAFLRGQERKYGKNTGGGELGNTIHKTNITVQGLTSHRGTSKIWCTPKGNAIVLRKRIQNQSKIMVESIDRLLKFFTDFSMGIGFIIPEIVFTNDQDLG
ncbi:hypothetical protein [Hymenobacter chitinivorans]|uniref:Uncharacterized protein n=1 Tax=Hymenobacter chitinivorans DSM 11115 TaxID=1121954 RepID=A0A2M9BNF9_9BACT|nr:hypothetical protein [Hymenobacter chitinivorans]PJJ59430.1 hypothetical protein CLV45_0847 [Hymenobacter chitinivorans DSM 11115]